MKETISEEEATLLDSLEKEGLLSPKIAQRVRAALRVSNSAGRFRSAMVLMFFMMILTACLWSGSAAFWEVSWARVLLLSLSAVTSSGAFVAGVTAGVEADKR